ncbi:hypothetical protein ACJJTC_007571 [Scirpophaga incertulas]
MDQDVNNLLDAWGFSHYKDIFAANKIDLNSFALLTEELVKELVGPIGDRAKFSKNLKDWISLTNPNKPLKELLRQTLEGRALLRVYSESGLLSNTGRRKICNIIIKNLFRRRSR